MILHIINRNQLKIKCPTKCGAFKCKNEEVHSVMKWENVPLRQFFICSPLAEVFSEDMELKAHRELRQLITHLLWGVKRAAAAVLAGPIKRAFLTSLSHSLGALVIQGQHHCPDAEHIKVSPSTVRTSRWRRLVSLKGFDWLVGGGRGVSH